jgi:hypothetical protein
MSDICREIEILAAGGNPMPIPSLLDTLNGEFASFATWLENFRNNSARTDDK